MNLALTKLNELLRFPPTSIAICIFIFITVMSLAKSCENSSDNGFRVEHSARMGGGLWQDTLNRPTEKEAITNMVLGENGGEVIDLSDTTKKPIPQQKIVVNRYVLVGSDTMFQLLFNQVQSPDDVTKRQLNTLIKWLQTSIRQDTTVKN